jgi:hypothetical protein
VPWYVTVFLKLINPFIDPVTKTKLRYNEPLTDHIPPSQLMKNAGGEVDFAYDHSVYWPALEALASQRRKEHRERWEAAGKVIGESEIYMWGGDEKSIGGGESSNGAVAPEAPAQMPAQTETDTVAVSKTEIAADPDAVTEKKNAELADGVAKLDVKDLEQVKAEAATS